ncbi:ferric-rhodotorulic acid transporter [Pseudoalteromonas phenolica]|uniref:Ferric-rhodotorulic acid transporter n=1 Tax=Pseudoalteromonas phenolica TaxID=161398 RepID=A0A4V2EJI3_9GAMM|nr:TonB-dependent receptor [Pseudoalteromonas phenolica]RZQ52448.1 ferric-rhodotorulic acid transporter [Pseudoalteromonas phenolica]
MKIIIPTFSFLSLLFTGTVFSSNETEEDLFDLSFEQLLDVNISLATKTDETRSSVPSSITVFNQQHISLLGVSNAYELMNFVPGFQSTRGDWVGAVPKEHTRGIYLDSGNVLVMINGQRVNEPSFGKASVYMPFIPIEMIERVEFIRGPGSALYGSNAFLGVMNVVTTDSRSQVSASIGEHGEVQAGLSFNKQIDDDLKLYSNLSFNRRDGENYEFGVKDPMEAYFLEFGAHWQDLHVSIRQNATQLDEFINLAGTSKGNHHHSENTAFNAKYEWLDEEDLWLTSSLDYIRHEIESRGLIASADGTGLVGDFFVGPAWSTKDITFKVDGSYIFSPELQVNFGLEYSEEEQFKAGVFTSYYDYERGDTIVANEFFLGEARVIDTHPPFKSLLASFDSYAAYSQAKYKASEKLTMFVGARFDEVKGIDSKLSPRLAFIYDLNQHHTLKLQYGESFRTPVSNELYSNDDVTVGNTDLTSEYVKTTELVWHAQHDDWQIDVVLFNNDLKDFINLVPTDQAQTRYTFDNVFEATMQGLEINSNFNLSENTWFEAGFTQLFDEPINPSFKRFAAAALTHQLNTVQVSLNSIWRDDVFVESPDKTVSDDFKQSDYFLIGFTANWSIDESKSLILKAQNLLDKQYKVFDPRMPDGNVPSQSRKLLLQYRQSF